MDAIERLTTLFGRFPGIGPRQAGRFVQYLLRSNTTLRRELIESVKELGEKVHQCPECFRFHSSEQKTCGVCTDTKRDHQFLAVVASDADLSALEHSGTYLGHYFVLGGTISLANEKAHGLRIKQLLNLVAKRLKAGLKEVILAFPANPEGDATASRIRQELLDMQNQSLTISSLGRGLSTGSELEYADSETIKNAFEGRK